MTTERIASFLLLQQNENAAAAASFLLHNEALGNEIVYMVLGTGQDLGPLYCRQGASLGRETQMCKAIDDVN